jgi:hypothetical protein
MWNPEKQIENMKPSINKFLAELQKQGISFSSVDGELNNVVFTKGSNIAKISHHSFYRYSGISTITRDKKDSNNEIEVVDVSDELYLNKFIKPLVLKLLSNEKE